jgi:Kef-type K+ transport system membrane component KefB
MEVGVFEQVAAVLFVCMIAGAAALVLRQPLVVGLIAAGIAVGPQALGLVDDVTDIELLAKLGIALLLFIVGLKLDVRLIGRLGPVALATGLGQVLFTSVIGFFIALALGFETVPALYIAVALTFSSTIIIVKLLTDKREIDDLHGRIAIGFLIVQDIAVVLAMIAITASGDASGPLGIQILNVIARGVVLVGLVILFGRYVATRLVSLLARQSELLILGAVTWAVALASVSILLGFSEEVGAFLAGLSLASTPYRDAISGRLSTLRDFMLVFFFIELGTLTRPDGTGPDRCRPDLLCLRARREPHHRDGDHGRDGLPQEGVVQSRTHRRADQRVLPHPGRARCEPGADRERRRRAHHRRRSHHDCRIDLPHLRLGRDLCAHRAAAVDLRT